MQTKTFENYLQEKFMQDAPEEVGSKDTFEDNFNNWLEYQGADMLIQFAEEWGNYKKMPAKEFVKLHDEMTTYYNDNYKQITREANGEEDN